MKVTLGGRYRVHELGDALDRVMQNLLVNGVDEVQAVTFYLSLFRENQFIHLTNEEGEKIEHLRFDGPRRRTFQALTDDVHVAPSSLSQKSQSDD